MKSGFFALPPWLNRDLRRLFLGRALRSAAQACATIIIPLFLARLGYDATRLGILLAACAAVSAALSVLAGVAGDRFGRKPVLIFLSLMTAVCGFVLAFASSFATILAAAALGNIGRGSGAGTGGAAGGPFSPPEQALTAEHTGDDTRTTVFSKLSFVGVIATAVGSLLAMLPDFVEDHTQVSLIAGFRAMFILIGVAGAAMAIVVASVHEQRIQCSGEIKTRRKASQSLRPALQSKLGLSSATWRLVVRFMAVNGLNGLGGGVLGPFLVYWFYRCYGVGPGTLGGFFFIINIFAAAPYLFADRVALRLGAVTTIVIIRGSSALLLVAMALSPSFWLVAVIYAVRTATNTLSIPVRESYLMGVINPAERAGASGVANLSYQAASSVSPYIAGFLMDNMALAAPLGFAAIAQAIQAVLYYLFFRTVIPPEEQIAESVHQAQIV